MGALFSICIPNVSCYDKHMTEKILLNPNREFITWGPINGHALYFSDFLTPAFKSLPKYYPNIQWPETLIVYKKEKIYKITEKRKLEQLGSIVLDEYFRNKHQYKKIIIQYQQAAMQLCFMQRTISKKTLQEMTTEEFENTMECWITKFHQLCAYSLLPELAQRATTQQLQEILQNKSTDKKQYHNAKNVLLEALERQHEEQEENELLKRYCEATPSTQQQSFQEHAQKYSDIFNGYLGVKKNTTQACQKRLQDFPKTKKKIQQLLKEREQGIQKRKQQLEYYVKKLKLNTNDQHLLDIHQYCMMWIDDQKKKLQEELSFFEMFVKEIGDRKKLKHKDMKHLPLEQLLYCFQKKKNIRQPQEIRAVIGKRNEILSTTPKQARELYTIFFEHTK